MTSPAPTGGFAADVASEVHIALQDVIARRGGGTLDSFVIFTKYIDSEGVMRFAYAPMDDQDLLVSMALARALQDSTDSELRGIAGIGEL